MTGVVCLSKVVKGVALIMGPSDHICFQNLINLLLICDLSLESVVSFVKDRSRRVIIIKRCTILILLRHYLGEVALVSITSTHRRVKQRGVEYLTDFVNPEVGQVAQ